jgi:hypothetical protein
MSDDFDDFLSDEQKQNQATGKDLRARLEEAVKQLKAITTERDALLTEKTTRELAGVWDTLKVPEPIRDFYKGDQNKDAIEKWWEASKGFFNVQERSEEKPAGQQAAPQELTPQQQAMASMQQLASLGSDRPVEGSTPAVEQKQTELLRTSPRSNPDGAADYLASLGFVNNGPGWTQA